jgi:hypothetical protein
MHEFLQNFSRQCNLKVRGRREKIYSTLYVYLSKMSHVTLFGDNPFKSYIEINLSIALTHFWFSNIRFPELLDII